MGENDISARLRALATDEKRRPETARLRDVFDDVEAALRAGVHQADVLAELHQAGFKMTLASFKSALQRIRKERSASSSEPKPAIKNQEKIQAPAAEITTPKENTADSSDEAQNKRITNPGDIRKARRREIDLDDL